VQKFDWKAIETDVGEVVGTETQSDGDALRNTIQRPLGKILETGKMKMQQI